MKIDLCVVGLGYIGLPTAALFAESGLRVEGVDVNGTIVTAVNAARAPFGEPGLEEMLGVVVPSGRLHASNAPVEASAYLVAVGTPLGPDKSPVLDHVRSACKAIAPVLRPGALVIIESTVPPGTTTGLVREILESGSGMRAGVDFYLAQCPERAIPGTALREMRENERLVGGIDVKSAQAAAALYARFVRGEVHLTDAQTSEIVKLAENSYRDVNIALANELSDLCEASGADVRKVIALANKHPRVHLHLPGPGVGGHCIPVAPWFLISASPLATPLLRLSREINDARAGHVIARVQALLADMPSDARVVVAGVAYKAGVDDARESPALPIIEGLIAKGLDVVATDPKVTRFARPLSQIDDALVGADVLIVVQPELAYRDLDPEVAAKRMRGRMVYDACDALDPDAWARAGFRVFALGHGGCGGG